MSPFGAWLLVSEQLHYITNREEIFYFVEKNMPYLCGLWRFANAYSEYSMSKVKMSDGKEIIIGKSRRKQFKDEFINHELMED